MADGDSLPTKFLLQIPGILRSTTTAYSNAQALAYGIYQAFQTRNEFHWNQKIYSGEEGVKQLINDLMNDPRTFVDFVQPLPGMPSAPLTMQLPVANPLPQPPAQPQIPPAPQAPVQSSQPQQAMASVKWIRRATRADDKEPF